MYSEQEKAFEGALLIVASTSRMSIPAMLVAVAKCDILERVGWLEVVTRP